MSPSFEQRGNELLVQRSQEFLHAIEWGGLVLEKIRRAQFTLTDVRYLHPGKSRYWALRVKVPPHLQDGFGLAPELMIAVVDGEFQARDLAAADRQIQEDEQSRLDRDLVIVTSNDKDLVNRLEQLPAARGRCLAWRIQTKEGGWELDDLNDVLWSSVATYDIFDERDPVRGRHVIGRRDELWRLRGQVLAGKSVGMFGLRKVGKTTIVRRVTDELDPLSVDSQFRTVIVPSGTEPRALVFFTDIQDIVTRSCEAVVEIILLRIRERLLDAGLAPPSYSGSAVSRLEQTLEFALKSQPLPLCLVLDEYDYLFEPSPIEGIAALLRILRAKAQVTQRLALVVIGRDPTHFQAPKLEGAPNPVLSWFQETWIGPFDKDAANETLRKLGRRVGLEMGPQTLDLALAWTLGHPLLHRQFGSAVWTLLRRGNKDSARVATDPGLKQASRIFCEKDAVLTVCREVHALLSERYPSALALLRDLTQERQEDAVHVIDMHGGATTIAARTLRRFGLVGGTEQAPLVPELFRWYLKNEGG